MKTTTPSDLKRLDTETKKALDEHAPCEDTMRNVENYFEYKRAKTSLDSFVFEMEKLQSRFETFEKAVSQFEPLSRDIVVSQLKVLKSTPSLNDIKTLNYLLDDLSKPEDATLMNGDYGKYSNEYDYNFKAMKGTELEEKYKKEYEKHKDSREEALPF